MAHVEGIELEERTLKLMERFEHLYGGTVTVEEFLEANEKTHKDVNLEVYEIYRDLLPILQKQVLKVANYTPEYDEDEE